MKRKNICFITSLAVFIICILSLTLYYTVFAKTPIKRSFEEGANFYVEGKVIEREPVSKENQTSQVELKGSFVREISSVGNKLNLEFYLDNSGNMYGSANNFAKIEVTNTIKENLEGGKLTCQLYSVYFNINDDMQRVYLDTFTIEPSKTTTYVFEVLKPGCLYYLDFYNGDKNIPISFDITVTSAYDLEKLGVDSITNIPKEFTYPVALKEKDNVKTQIEGQRTFRIDAGNHNNLDLMFNNKSNEDYTLFVYDISTDVFDNKTMSYDQAMVKEYEIKANTDFKETLTKTKAKSYKVDIVPSSLKSDYLKIEKLQGEIRRENNEKNIDIDLDSKKQKNLDEIRAEYAKDFENVISKQKGDFSYKLYD